jgi:hypothetical protein
MATKKTIKEVIKIKATPKEIVDDLFTVEIKEGDLMTVFKGDNLEEILLNYKPFKITAKTVLTVSKGMKSFTKVYNVHQAKRLLTNPINIMLLNKYAETKLN